MDWVLITSVYTVNTHTDNLELYYVEQGIGKTFIVQVWFIACCNTEK